MARIQIRALAITRYLVSADPLEKVGGGGYPYGIVYNMCLDREPIDSLRAMIRISS